MSASAGTLGDRVHSQIQGLCSVLNHNSEEPTALLMRLLGPHARRPLSAGPPSNSDIADDATPVEFSIAFDDHRRPCLRVLAEAVAESPSLSANVEAAENLLVELSEHYDLNLDPFNKVREAFSAENPYGTYVWWYSFIFPPHQPPRIKVYFNPNIQGAGEATRLVKEALDRLEWGSAYQTISEYGLQRSEDEPIFFALDLHADASARVKVYLAHRRADENVVQRAARAVPGTDSREISRFLRTLSPEYTVFDRRPLISSYSFVHGDAETPSTYSLYHPMRSYVPHDAIARERVEQVLRERTCYPAPPYAPARANDLETQAPQEPSLLDRVLKTLTHRPLNANRGLLAHVSLKVTAISKSSPVDSPNDLTSERAIQTRTRRGNTIYLSSEAFGGTTPDSD